MPYDSNMTTTAMKQNLTTRSRFVLQAGAFGIVVCLLGWAAPAAAQQLAQFSTWLANPYLYNPAAAGMDNTLVANGIYRQQWVDLDGAPVSQHLDASIPLRVISSGVGLRLDNDALGAHQTTQAMVSYNYQLEIGRSGVISFGAGLGFQQYTLNGDRLRAPQGDYLDPAFQHNDAFLPLGRISAGAPAIELGMMYSSASWLVGVAALPVFAPDLVQNTENGKFRLRPSRHYALQTRYTYALNEKITLLPGLLLKSDFIQTQAEIGSLLVWKEKLTVGAAYRGYSRRSKDAGVLMAGLRINDKTRFLYAFDIPVSGLQAVNRGSHELVLQYYWGRPVGAGKLPPIIYNPRFR